MVGVMTIIQMQVVNVCNITIKQWMIKGSIRYLFGSRKGGFPLRTPSHILKSRLL